MQDFVISILAFTTVEINQNNTTSLIFQLFENVSYRVNLNLI